MNLGSQDIKNYTSGVPVETTVARIEAKLAAAGANGVMKRYDEQRQLAGLVFTIELGDTHYAIQLPAKSEACFTAMWAEYKRAHRRGHATAEARIRAQAGRTAWRIVEDWVNIQISMIVLKQADWLEIFMGYVMDGNQTVFQRVQSGALKLLPENNSDRR